MVSCGGPTGLGAGCDGQFGWAVGGLCFRARAEAEVGWGVDLRWAQALRVSLYLCLMDRT